MSDTAKTLVLIGGILNLILAIGMIAAFVVMFGWMLMEPMLMMVALLAGGIFIALAILGLLFGILPLMWRDNPGAHRVGLIILGILSLGTVGGLLLLIGGIIAEEEKA